MERAVEVSAQTIKQGQIFNDGKHVVNR